MKRRMIEGFLMAALMGAEGIACAEGHGHGGGSHGGGFHGGGGHHGGRFHSGSGTPGHEGFRGRGFDGGFHDHHGFHGHHHFHGGFTANSECSCISAKTNMPYPGLLSATSTLSGTVSGILFYDAFSATGYQYLSPLLNADAPITNLSK